MEALEPIVVQTSDYLENPGDSMPVSGHLDMLSYVVGDVEYKTPYGVDYDVVLTHAGDGILVSGMVRAQAEGICDRCLDSAYFDIAGEVDEYFLFEVPEDEDGDEEVELVGEENTVDLSGAINDAVVMETPFVLLCKEDCLGLCPTCGINLNHESCNCEDKRMEEKVNSPENPFAALKDLKLD